MSASPLGAATGADLVELLVRQAGAPVPGFVSAQVIPSRALMLLQARARLPDGREVDVIFAPGPATAAAALDGGPQDFRGNASFSFGGAVLAPFANRIRGHFMAASRSIDTLIMGRWLRLPANGGGKATGAEQYAIHGLVLETPAEQVRLEQGPASARVSGRIRAGDFGVGWPASTELTISWTLAASALSLRVVARNAGVEPLPIGIGWHPYFAIPSGRREQARLRLPARSRIMVNNYDEVLPTGEVRPVAAAAFDFQAPGGAALGDRYLDDCFTDLDKTALGHTVCELIDPAAGYGLRMTSVAPQISAIQVFTDPGTDPGRPFVVIEPQFNLADPYGGCWAAGRDTGMVVLQPGNAVEYDVTLELFTP